MKKTSKVVFKKNGNIKKNITKKDLKYIDMIDIHIETMDSKLKNRYQDLVYEFKIIDGKIVRYKCINIVDKYIHNDTYRDTMVNKM